MDHDAHEALARTALQRVYIRPTHDVDEDGPLTYFTRREDALAIGAMVAVTVLIVALGVVIWLKPHLFASLFF